MNDSQKDVSSDVVLERELMELKNKHSINHRSINRKVFFHRLVKIALVIFIAVSVLAILFILIFRYVEKEVNVDKTRFGDYQIKVKNSETLKLSYDADIAHSFNTLYASGRSGVNDLSNEEEVYLLAQTGSGFIINDFINLANASSYEFYHDGDDRGYIDFSKNYYVNKFYLFNSSNNAQNYQLEIKFIDLEGGKDCYKVARFIVAENIDGKITYQAYGVAKDDGSNEIVSHSRPHDSSRGYVTSYLLNPNIEDYKDGAKIDLKNKEDLVEDIWYVTNLEKTEDRIYAYQSDKITLEAKEKAIYTIMLYFDASDSDHSAEMSDGKMTFELNFNAVE